MPVLKFDPAKRKREYGILCHRSYPAPGLPTPFGSSHCTVAPGESTTLHGHHEHETFFIASGEGSITIDGATDRVGPGDVVYLPAHSQHLLVNPSKTEPLVFTSVWWEDPGVDVRARPARALVTAAPPTPNGDLHLGHLSGPYVAADVHARYLRMRGVPTWYLSGSDDNQSYTDVKGRQTGKAPSAVAEHFGNANLATLGRAGVRVDRFLRPGRDPGYVAFVKDFFTRLAASGAIQPRDAPSLWCTKCDLYLYEAHVSGGCPHCKTPTNGNGCEPCGLPNDCVELADPRCNHCKTPATRRTVKRFYFPLAAHRDRLVAYWDTVSMSPRLRALTRRILEKGLPDLSVTHVAGWGIPVPDPSYPGQVIFEWFEMAAGYLYAAAGLSPTGRWEDFFADPGTQVTQFYGIDNAFYYTTFLPALFMAYAPGARAPGAFVTNEFYLLEGKKFSTSRRHAIWGDEVLAHVPPDPVRFYLAWDGPEHAETSFTVAEFEATVRRELVEGWGGWLRELDARLPADRTVPAAGARSPEQADFARRATDLVRELAAAYEVETFSLRRAARLAAELARQAREFGRLQQFQHGVDALSPAAATGLALELGAARAFALALSPLVPGFAGRLLAALDPARAPGPDGPRWDGSLTPLAPGTRLGTLPSAELAAIPDAIGKFRTSRTTSPAAVAAAGT